VALNKAALAAAIQTAFTDAREKEWDPPQIAAALADAIDAYVRGAAVTGVKATVPIDLNTTTVSGHLHKVSGTLTATQNVNGKLE
jgi:hypothetical protein